MSVTDVRPVMPVAGMAGPGPVVVAVTRGASLAITVSLLGGKVAQKCHKLEVSILRTRDLAEGVAALPATVTSACV